MDECELKAWLFSFCLSFLLYLFNSLYLSYIYLFIHLYIYFICLFIFASTSAARTLEEDTMQC